MSRAPTLIAQLRLRNAALSDYVNGVAEDPLMAYPTTLEAYRLWDEPKLGILKIGSKSSVDQKSQARNPEKLALIVEASKLIGSAFAVANRKRRAPKKTQTKTNDELKAKLKKMSRAFNHAQARNHELLHLLSAAVESKVAAMNAQMEAVRHVRELRHQLNQQVRGLSVVPTSEERAASAKADENLS